MRSLLHQKISFNMKLLYWIEPFDQSTTCHVFCSESLRQVERVPIVSPSTKQDAPPKRTSISTRREELKHASSSSPSPMSFPTERQHMDEKPCQVCHDGNDDDNMLRCDGCNCGFHLYCLRPPLSNVPNHAWLCSWCEKRGKDEPPHPRKKKRGSSKYLGVCRVNNVWRARIYHHGKSIYLGKYNTELEAHAAVQAAKRRYAKKDEQEDD